MNRTNQCVFESRVNRQVRRRDDDDDDEEEEEEQEKNEVTEEEMSYRYADTRGVV